MVKRNSGYAFHVHHNVLVEYCTDYRGRVDYIRNNKPEDEVELRIRLFKLIPLKYLPEAYVEAGKACAEAWRAYDKAWKAYTKAGKACDEARRAYDKAWRAYDKAWKACDEAGRAYDKAWKACNEAGKACEPELIALHDKLCPNCPWNGMNNIPIKISGIRSVIQ